MHFAHATDADELEHLVAAEPLSRRESHTGSILWNHPDKVTSGRALVNPSTVRARRQFAAGVMAGLACVAMPLSLTPHPAFRSPAIQAVEVDLAREPGGFIARYRPIGALDSVKRPPLETPARADDLWRTTCFEAFLATDDGGYYELNFSPSRRWAVYRFDGYRAGMRPSDDVGEPRVELREDNGGFELAARFAAPSRATRLGLSAIIEDNDGTKSYWALAHPDGSPDFHHPVSFALDLLEHR
jgi:hypothetical protein